MKKAMWLHKPQSISSSTLHSAEFTVSDKASIYSTVGEDGELILAADISNGQKMSFVFFHTPNDRIVFTSNEIKSTFFGLYSAYNIPDTLSQLKIVKEKDEIVFSSPSSILLKVKNPSFYSSASFGIIIEGEGKASVSIW